MIGVKDALIVVLFVVVVWLGWTTLDLAIENDGLKQVAESHKQSINSLLEYARAATRCNLTAEELATKLHTSVSLSKDRASKEVAHLAFHARFNRQGVVEVGIVDVHRVVVCQAN